MKFLVDNWYLVLLVAVSGAALFIPALQRRASGDVSVFDAVRWINSRNAVVIDVRPGEAFESGHIIGAKNIPASELEQRSVELGKPSLGKSAQSKPKPIVVVCETGRQSATAAALVRKLGFAEVAGIAGGMAGWRAAGLPVVK